MISSVLIANRGEIACRIIRTAQKFGIRTIAVYSEADKNALHVQMADEAHAIGPAAPRESYLVIDKIIAAAKAAKAEAIHPGYGFLSERAEFAKACAENGIIFIGPPASAIEAMGLKDGAKKLMEKAGVPVVPGYHGDNQDAAFLAKQADNIGYPVLIKAVAGGGGKGMKRVDDPRDFADSLASAQREAQNAFGDPHVLIEKYILSPRHIEIQVFGDSKGNVVHLFERDCSLQRRHQKVIEEAPAPGMPPAMREAMGKAAVEAAKAVGYVGAGTVEFIADGSKGLQPDRFWFMEMNTRLQVEHPVTEAITGLDLVEWQFRVASGEKLPLSQKQLKISGHAVEARLYAEDPEHGFLPSTGKLSCLEFPEIDGIRIDTGVEEEDEVTPYYDPMIAKIIAHGDTRDEALDLIGQALGETLVAGPRSNVRFLKALTEAKGFRDGAFDTGFIDRNITALGAEPQPLDGRAVAAAVRYLVEHESERTSVSSVALTGAAASSPWQFDDAFSLTTGRRKVPVRVDVDGERLETGVIWGEESLDVVIAGEVQGDAENVRLVWDKRNGEGRVLYALRDGRQTTVRLTDPFDVDLDHLDASGAVKAPMHGKVVSVLVSVGQTVAKGDRLAVLEAMKMEHTLTAPVAGVVTQVNAVAGEQIGQGAIVVMVGE